MSFTLCFQYIYEQCLNPYWDIIVNRFQIGLLLLLIIYLNQLNEDQITIFNDIIDLTVQRKLKFNKTLSKNYQILEL
ncbi:hypothetical protein pb186bvf_005655 [Paramecium bursaria]